MKCDIRRFLINYTGQLQTLKHSPLNKPCICLKQRQTLKNHYSFRILMSTSAYYKTHVQGMNI